MQTLKISFILISCFIYTHFLEAADLGAVKQEYQKMLETVTPERKIFIHQLLREWAPEFFQATDVSKKDNKFQMPAYDVISSPFFDGDKNVKNNAANLEGRKLRAEVFGTFWETDTHYFVMVSKYNVVDVALVGGHNHDAEGVWMAIRKDGSPKGKLEFLATNRHALPEFYSPDPEFQTYLRAQFEKLKSEEKVRTKWTDMFSGLDSTARQHDKSVAAKRGTNFFPIAIYSAPEKHALSICDRDLWKTEGTPSGIHLICKARGEEDEIDPANISSAPYGYSFLLMNDFIQNYYLDETPEKKKERALIFEEGIVTGGGGNFSNSFGELENRAGLPTTWAKGEKEKKAEANFDWDLRLQTGADPYTQPHRVLELMYRDLPPDLAKKYDGVGKDYLFNQHLKVVSISPSILTNKMTECFTNSWDKDLRNIILNQSAK